MINLHRSTLEWHSEHRHVNNNGSSWVVPQYHIKKQRIAPDLHKQYTYQPVCNGWTFKRRDCIEFGFKQIRHCRPLSTLNTTTPGSLGTTFGCYKQVQSFQRLTKQTAVITVSNVSTLAEMYDNIAVQQKMQKINDKIPRGQYFKYASCLACTDVNLVDLKHMPLKLL
jgi:hypothetical protein